MGENDAQEEGVVESAIYSYAISSFFATLTAP